ncbi:hypothetical protein K1W54_04245 [Micromonospora sp. CPCC 205371]|nr:hypothetical protein [Micromonospora sp. CPCC 205371]
MRLYIFDASALIDFHGNYDPLRRLYYRAVGGELLLGWPAVALAEATAAVETDWDEWWAIMLGEPAVIGLPLVVQAAAEIARWPGALDVRHCVWEARATSGAVVTRKPSGYEGHRVPLLVV